MGFRVQARVRTLSFEPAWNAPRPLYWGYLLRIGRFVISHDDRSFVFEDTSAKIELGAIAKLDSLRETFLAKARRTAN
jgi:hypothetical protein